MARNLGRPTKPIEELKRVVSVSLGIEHIEILDALGAMNDCTRSQTVRKMIEENGLLSGIAFSNDGVQHICHKWETNGYRLKKTGLKACNPYTNKGECRMDVCQDAYRKEGL